MQTESVSAARCGIKRPIDGALDDVKSEKSDKAHKASVDAPAVKTSAHEETAQHHDPAQAQQKLHTLLQQNPRLKTNQDLINHFYKHGHNSYEGAEKVATQHGVDMHRLVTNRRGSASETAKAAAAKTSATPARADGSARARHQTEEGGARARQQADTTRRSQQAPSSPATPAAPLSTPTTPDVSANLDKSIATVRTELSQKAPDVLRKVDAEVARVRTLPTDADKSAALEQGFQKLAPEMDALRPKLSPAANDAWRNIAHAVGDGHNILKQARMADPAFQRDRAGEMTSVVRSLTQDLAEKHPETLAKILSTSRQIAALPDGPGKVAQLKQGYDALDKFVTAHSNEMSPQTRAQWQEFKARVDEGFADGSVLPLERLTRASTLATVNDIINKPGLAHNDPQMIAQLRVALAPLQARADENTSDQGVSFKQLMHIVPGMSEERAKAVAPDLNRVMRERHITTVREKAEFIAQTAHESAGYRHYEEEGNNAYFTRHYEGRVKDLGNTQPGDGAKFHGRGAIQVTGRANYKELSEDTFGDDRLLKNPELAAKLPLAMDSAGWYWDKRKLNRPADAGDFRSVTVKINGGTNGWHERLSLYTKALAELA